MNNGQIVGIVGGVIGYFFLWLFSMAIAAFILACMWRIFTKAGKPGWAALVPFYNTLVMLEFLGRPWWFLLLMFVPLANVVIEIIIIFDYAKSFGKSTAFGFGLLFLSIIFIPILAFGPSRYIGPATGI
jgi:hypothetical protein